MNTVEEFWHNVDQLVGSSELVIDRPRGSAHPRYPDLVYPLDYGYLAGTSSADGGGIDVWLGSQEAKRPTAVICTVDLRKRDSEIKILLGCSEDEIGQIMEMVNSGPMRGILIRRQATQTGGQD